MFPARSKSAKVKKEAQILQGFCQLSDESSLLETALRLATDKVIVKRPLKAPVLLGPKPDYALQGKTIRYDVYFSAPRA